MKNHFHVSSSILVLAAALLAPGIAHAQTAPAQNAPAQPTATGTEPTPPAITVTGTRPDVTSAPDRLSFNIANDLQAQTGTVADALRSVPGVEVDVQGNVSLRGDSGVTILIDGRPSAMLNGDNRGDVLLSMPAGNIERVEVITNPSAAMSPEGSAGAINLVTKRTRQNSRSATIKANAGPEGRGSLNVNGSHSGNGLTVTGDVGLRRFTAEPEATQLRSRLDPLTDTFIDSRQDSQLDNRMKARMARFGADYDLDKSNRLSAEFGHRKFAVDVDREDRFVSEDAGSSFDRISDIDLRNRGFNARGSWRHTLGEDHELVADLQLEKTRMRRQVEAITDFEPGESASELIRNAINQRELNPKLDYTRPMGEGASLNLGYEGDFEDTDFDFTGERGPSLDELIPVPALTNAFGYDQDVHALFGTYRFELGKFQTQAGLRLEQADIGINQITEGLRFKNDYFRAYPTLHVNYTLSESQQLRGSYSRRIQRPSPQDLNPYTFYIDPLNLRRGNPFLDPEVTDSFELGWQSRKGGTLYSLTSFYRRSRGGVTDIITDIGGGVFLTTRENLATANRAGVEALASGKLGTRLSYNASATVMWQEIDPRLNGISDPRSGTTVNARANLNWQPTKNDFLQLNALYPGRQILPQGYRKSSAMLNLGYRRKVSEKLSLLLTAQDVLKTAKQTIVFDTPTLRNRITQTGPGRFFLFGITYNLGGTGRQRQEPQFDFQQGAGAGDGAQ
ncbi:MAG TPA: TonB-dependent receptor [Sphingomicrobium sp.]|nr:TonB-dependent receptor [Sphingomicrobium sp.]